MLHALVVEDDKNALSALAELVADEGFKVEQATSVRTARARLAAQTPDVVLLDLILPDGTGFDLIQDLQGQTDRVEIVVITGHASVSTAVDALRHGASDYLTKPVDVARLKLMLANLTRSRELRPRLSELRRQVRQLGRFGTLVGASPAMEQVYEMVSRVAPSSASVLITGESGTGKELVAGDRSSTQPARRQSVPGGELRGALADVDRKRAVRARARELHRRRSHPPRLLRARRRRHALPRRGERDAARRSRPSCCGCWRRAW